MGIEDKYAQSINFSERLPSRLIEDTERRQKLLALKEQIYDIKRPQIEDFTDIFSKEEIEFDTKEMNTSLRLFELKSQMDGTTERNEVSELFEAALSDTIRIYQLFGENFLISPASRVDDIKHGIDSYGTILRDDQDEAYIGLGFDVTYSEDYEILSKKIESIKSVIKDREQKLPTLKYCMDRNGNHISVKVPKVIIGTTGGIAEKLIRSWGYHYSSGREIDGIGILRCKMIVEVLAQAQYFVQLAKRYENLEAYNAYAILNNYFHSLFEENYDEIVSNWDVIQDDKTFQRLNELVNFES